MSRHEEAVDEATRRIEQSAQEAGGGSSSRGRRQGSKGTGAQERERAQRQLVETALERAGTHLEHSVLLSLDALLLACFMQHQLSPVCNDAHVYCTVYSVQFTQQYCRYSYSTCTAVLVRIDSRYVRVLRVRTQLVHSAHHLFLWQSS